MNNNQIKQIEEQIKKLEEEIKSIQLHCEHNYTDIMVYEDFALPYKTFSHKLCSICGKRNYVQ
jgi:hypothetical protein